MRSPSEMDIIQLEVTDACESRCGGCTRLVSHIKKPFYITSEQWTRNIKSMEGWQGKVLGAMGGNPVLHPDFAQLSYTFADMWGRPTSKKLGREPIKDFSQYAMERLNDPSSGRGLWSSLGAGFYRNMEVIHDVYSYWCINDHVNPGLHQSLLIDRETFNMLNKQTDDQWLENRDNCWVQNTWSASINHHGAYFCEVAAAIDNLFHNGKHAWPAESGWWKRTPKDFNDQLHLCNHCALAQKGPSMVAHDDTDIVSAKLVVPLQQLGSPAAKHVKAIASASPTGVEFVAPNKTLSHKTGIEIYNPGDSRHQPTGRDFRIDWYMPEPHMRVSPENGSIRPRKLTGIVTCVGRAPHLARTIRHNKEQVDELFVVTSPEDKDTQEICRAAGVLFVESQRCHHGSAAFNKGALINDGLAAVMKPDWFVLTDADVLLNQGLKDFVHSHSLNPGVLYGTVRLEDGRNEDDYLKDANAEANGYFQMFHRSAKAVRYTAWGSDGRWPNVMSESFCSAGGVDSWFLQQFSDDKRVILPQLAVRHVNHGNEMGSGWNGRKRRGVYRQTAMLNAKYLIEIEPIPKAATHLRLTDTHRGRSFDIDLRTGRATELLNKLVTLVDGKMYLGGYDLKGCHIQVSYYRP